MAYDLLAKDLSNFNVRNKPDTEELIEQKLHSLDPVERWWHDCLLRAGINEDDKWPEFVSTTDVILGIKYLSGNSTYNRPNSHNVVPQMKKLCPGVKHGQKQLMGARNRGFILPPLQQARTEFEEYIDGSI